MRIAVIGSGYVGLVTGACLANFGHEVTCIDKDTAKISALAQGNIPIFEPDLKEIVALTMAQKRLAFSTDLAHAVAASDAVFICVGTPLGATGAADLTHVQEATHAVAAAASGFTVVIYKSTVPVGTNDAMAAMIADHYPDADISVVSNPEFLREGAAIHDFKFPDRIVIGTADARARTVMEDIYRPIALDNTPILFTSRRTAELIKYASNAFLATKITFINEIADLCEKVGADVQEVSRGMGLDKRIGDKFLSAGPGYGGSCFPKDTMALVHTAQDFGAPLRIVETVLDINARRKRAMADKIIRVMGGDVRGKTIALLGLTFKPSTDDMRDAPAIDIAAGLLAAGACLRAYDPEGMAHAASLMPNITYAPDTYACVADADAVVLITEWDAFRALDLTRIHASLRGNVFIDLRNVYRPADMAALGFIYESVGRPS
jgi:UDPglucose 6-dehydrogenase